MLYRFGRFQKGFFAADIRNVLELSKNCLGSLGAKVSDVILCFNGANVRFEHQIECPWLRLVGSTLCHHFTWFLEARGIIELICPESPFAIFTIDHGITEGRCMSTGFPYLRMHDDGCIQSYNILPIAGHGLPPQILDITLQFSAQRAVVPEPVDASVDF